MAPKTMASTQQISGMKRKPSANPTRPSTMAATALALVRSAGTAGGGRGGGGGSGSSVDTPES